MQIYKYKVNLKMSYGIISSTNLSYLVHCMGDIIFISQAIACNNMIVVLVIL
jgi:hypothetical protein